MTQIDIRHDYVGGYSIEHKTLTTSEEEALIAKMPDYVKAGFMQVGDRPIAGIYKGLLDDETYESLVSTMSASNRQSALQYVANGGQYQSEEEYNLIVGIIRNNRASRAAYENAMSQPIRNWNAPIIRAEQKL